MVEDEKVWSAEWGNNILFSHGSAHSRGVCILQNPCSTLVRLCSILTDSEGRLIIAKVTMENKPFFILNIYAPTDYRDQDNFIKTISEHLASKTDTSKVIISGSLRASSLGGGVREGGRGESLQRCLRSFHFCVEKVDAKC